MLASQLVTFGNVLERSSMSETNTVLQRLTQIEISAGDKLLCV